MNTKTKKLFGILTLVIVGFFSWDFSVNTAFLQNEDPQFSDTECKNLSVTKSLSGSDASADGANSACGQTAGCRVDIDEETGNAYKCGHNSGLFGIGNPDLKNAREDANNNYCSTYNPKEYNGELSDEELKGKNGSYWNTVFENGDLTRASHGKTVFEGAESQVKTACKNDSQCKWSFGKCKGKSGASTQDYLKCSQAGLDKCGITIGCAISTDGTQCLPAEDEEFSGGEAHDEFGSYGGPVFGGPGLRAGARIAKQKLDNTISKERSLKKLIIYWTNFALSITAIIAVIALIYAGILYITDMGDGSNSEKAKKIIMYVAIGIIVILGSYAIVNTVMKARFGNEESAITYNHQIKQNQIHIA